jgi:hypothetical protein
MKVVVLIFAVVLLYACNTSNTAFKEKVAGADSVAINFFKGDGSMDTVVQVRIVTNRQSVELLSGFIAAASSQNYKCGYDGSLHYFKKGMVLQDVDFRMNDVQCMHFSFMLNGQLFATSLSAEARQFLESLKK